MTLIDPRSQAPLHGAHRHSGAMAQALPATFSVLRSSLGARLVFVLGLSAVMWVFVLWVIA
ncbi:hypothetical protein V5G24_16535 [Xanthobacter sp. VTT E-85241]|uniref:hypothetical protein n=1 Tax=Roseixanthobacter finlandensis TaxID=3119922 RepID=UPI003727EBAD